MRLNRRLLMAAAATAPLLGIRAADAAAPFLNTTAAPWYRFKLGTFEVTVVSDGPLVLPAPAVVFPNAPKPDMERLLAAGRQPVNAWTGPQNCVVVNTGRHLVLFDTGMGDRDKTLGPNVGKLAANLKVAGIDPASIDVVAITHAHIDHCWGLVDAQDKLVYPNARVAISQADFDHWTQESLLNDPNWRAFVLYTRTNLLPVRDRLIALRDGGEVVPGITGMATPGHSPGHFSFVIESEGRRLINVGDIVHHPTLQLRHPEWHNIFDLEAERGAATRRRVLEQLAESGTPVQFYHFPFPGVGTVAKDGGGFVWLPAPMFEG